jgi:hypothetical protein
MPAIEQASISFDDKLIYRYLIIPRARDTIRQQANQFEWMHQPPSGGAPAATIDEPHQILHDRIEGRRQHGQCGFPSIWNMSIRGQSLNWGGGPRTRWRYSSILRSAAATRSRLHQAREGNSRYLRSSRRRRSEGFPSIRPAAPGQADFRSVLRRLPRLWRSYLGKVIPITEIGTDPERFNTWSQEDADATNRSPRKWCRAQAMVRM